ncbi:MAG: phosphotransferase, partial [Steroidobacteraceae bacterium]
MINKTRSDHVTPLSAEETPFAGLSPERVLDAASGAGLDPDGRLFALNSYENRVYQLGDAGGVLILKFYRPGRWSDAQILEEHRFTAELAAAELPVAAPVAIGGQTLLRHREFRFAAFPYMRGGAPELDAPESRELLGRSLARLHQVGARRPFERRPQIGIERLGVEA